MEIETDRLWLRPWRADHKPAFAALNGDAGVMEFFPSTLSREQSDAMVDTMAERLATHGFGFWAVECRTTGQLVGAVGLNIPGYTLPFSPCVEVGWRIARKFWGQGFAVEAAHASFKVGFESRGLHEIVAFTAIDNRRSRRVMEKLGMREDELIFNHPNLPVGHRLRQHCLYRIGRADWVKQNSNDG